MSVEVKRHIAESDDLHDVKKQQYTKPGRKQIETEPKSKRTAQNRAAQRAYRERKEKRMQELEEKVKDLEDTNVQVTTESDYLKAQVEMLKNELARYTGHSDFNDINLPTAVGRLSRPQNNSTTSSSNLSVSSQGSNMELHGYGGLSSVSPNDFSWNQGSGSVSSKNASVSKFVNQNLPDLVGGGGSTSSSLPLDNFVSPPESQNLTNSTNFDGSNLDLGIKFEEEINPFCANLNEACGNKNAVVPKYRAPSKDETFANSESPFAVLNEMNNFDTASTSTSNATTNNAIPKYDLFQQIQGDGFTDVLNGHNYNSVRHGNQESTTQNDDLAFLNDNDNFDIALAFGDNFSKTSPDFDPISLLTTEDSIYDPLTNNNAYNNNINHSNNKYNANRKNSSTNSNFDFEEYIQTGSSGKPTICSISPEVRTPLEEENEVVPGPEETVKCSEIWDRITSHPRYTDIDIDSLCSELKNKAKCSEKGVVINSSDVTRLLEESVSK